MKTENHNGLNGPNVMAIRSKFTMALRQKTNTDSTWIGKIASWAQMTRDLKGTNWRPHTHKELALICIDSIFFYTWKITFESKYFS